MSVAGQLDIFEALRQRERSMERVTAAADRGYRSLLESALHQLANGGDVFSADDLRVLAGDPPAGCSPNLVGAVVNAAAKSGLIEFVDYTHSARVVGHGNLIRRWRGRNA